MATWRFRCQVIPRSANLAEGGEQVLLRPDKSWAGMESGEVLKALVALGMPAQTWDLDTVRFGEEDGTNVQVTSASSKVIEAALALDLRQRPWSPLVAALLELAATHDLTLVSEDGHCIEPTAAELARAAGNSAAARFVADPERFLQELERP